MTIHPEDPFPIRPDLVQAVRVHADAHPIPAMANRAVDLALANLTRIAPENSELHESYLATLGRIINASGISTQA